MGDSRGTPCQERRQWLSSIALRDDEFAFLEAPGPLLRPDNENGARNSSVVLIRCIDAFSEWGAENAATSYI